MFQIIKTVAVLTASACVFTFGIISAHAGDDDAKHKDHKVEAATSSAPLPDPYPLATCIVSGKKLGEMGDPIIKVYDGREIRFCCPACPAKFEADKAGYLKKLDDAIIAQQKPTFPSDVCFVSGDKLGGDMGKPIDYVFGNRYLNLCCKSCIKDLKKDPAKYLGAVDKAIIARDMMSYPLDTCVVSGDKLGSMGEPLDYIYAGRLVRLCCKDHLGKFLKNPSSYMTKLDDAAKSKAAK